MSIWSKQEKLVSILLWIIYVIYVLCLLCLRTRLFIDALWSPAWKGLTSWLLFVMCHFPMLYPGSGVVLNCIDSRSLPSFLLCGLHLDIQISNATLDGALWMRFRSSSSLAILLVTSDLQLYVLVDYISAHVRFVSNSNNHLSLRQNIGRLNVKAYDVQLCLIQ